MSDSTFTWATVTQVSPLRVQIDGDAAPIPATPVTLASPLAVGDRVRCELENNRLIVHGRYSGPASELPPGVMFPYPMRFAPSGFLLLGIAAPLRASYPALYEALCPLLGTFTVTIASPGVLTVAAHGLVVGDPVFLTTTGALPTGLAQNTIYYVQSVPTANTLTLAATKGGAAINTTGTQSGVHSLRYCPWGHGNGSTTFDLPPVPGRTIVGRDNSQSEFANLGQLVGAKTHTLQVTEMPSHRHQMAYAGGSGGAAGYYGGTILNNYSNAATDFVGGGGAHNNLQPSVAMNFIIKT